MGGEDARSDEELAAAAGAGDEAALRTLYRRNARPIQALLLRRIPPSLRRKVSVADVLQEAWSAAWTNLGGFRSRGPGSFRAWLIRIADHKARNVVRDLLRDRRDVRREVPREHPGIPTLGARATASPSAHAMAQELDARLKDAVGRLPSAQREVLGLVLVEGLSMAEAGRRMHRSANAVQKLFQRARDRLWTECTAHGGGPA